MAEIPDPLHEAGCKLRDFGTNAIETVLELPFHTDFDTYDTDSDSMRARFESLDDAHLQDSDNPIVEHLVILDGNDSAWSVLPKEWRDVLQNNLNKTFGGYATFIPAETEYDQPATVVYETEFSPRTSCRRWWFSIGFRSDGSNPVATLTYATEDEPVYRMTPVENEIRVLDASLPIEPEDIETARERAALVPVVDEHARHLADETFASYKAVFVALLDQYGLTHTEIAELTDTSRSTVSTQASRYNDLEENVAEKRQKLERTEMLLNAGSVSELSDISREML